MQYSLTGNDTLIINNRVINDLTDGSVVNISYQNDRVGISTGKNGNTVFADNRQGLNATLELRVLRGSKDDKYLNGLSIEQDRDMVASSVLNGQLSKRIGNGFGKISFDEYTLLGGMFQRFPDVQENNTGDTEQGTTVYTIIFANVTRGLV